MVFILILSGVANERLTFLVGKEWYTAQGQPVRDGLGGRHTGRCAVNRVPRYNKGVSADVALLGLPGDPQSIGRAWRHKLATAALYKNESMMLRL